MKKIFIQAFLVLLFCSNSINARILKETLFYEKAQLINNNNFIYKKRVVNGKIQQLWFVNDDEVTSCEFNAVLLEAKHKEWESQQELEEQKSQEQDNFNKTVRINILRKMLKLKLKEIDCAFKKIKYLEENNLSSFFVYDKNSVISYDELSDMEKYIVEDVEQSLAKACDQIEIDELNGILEKIDLYPDKLSKFFKGSVNNAINFCDDTKMLRKLLDLVS